MLKMNRSEYWLNPVSKIITHVVDGDPVGEINLKWKEFGLPKFLEFNKRGGQV